MIVAASPTQNPTAIAQSSMPLPALQRVVLRCNALNRVATFVHASSMRYVYSHLQGA